METWVGPGVHVRARELEKEGHVERSANRSAANDL